MKYNQTKGVQMTISPAFKLAPTSKVVPKSKIVPKSTMKQIVELIPTIIHRNPFASFAIVLLAEDRSGWEIALTYLPGGGIRTFTPRPTTVEEDDRMLEELDSFVDAAPQGRLVSLQFSKTKAILGIY